jgi:hypothetical protein
MEPTLVPTPDDDAPIGELNHGDFAAGAPEQVSPATSAGIEADPLTGGDEVLLAVGSGEATNTTAGEPTSPGAAMLPVAAALTEDRATFLRTLGDAVDAQLSPAARRALLHGGDPALGDATTAERIAAIVSDDPEWPAAAVCGALAARGVARALQHTERALDLTERETLLTGWLDAAQSLGAARGPEGLRMLLPIARLLARKTAGRGETVANIATAVRHVAARIAADPTLGPALGASGAGHVRQQMRRGPSGPPRRIVLHGPVEIAFHAR